MKLRMAVLFALANLGSMSWAAEGTVESGSRFDRKYSATAYISFLGIPIFSRSGVGYGYASSELAAGEGQGMNFTFLSATEPSRAHGLNRFGFVQEQVKDAPGASLEAHYWAFMTSSGEDSFQDAKAALEKPKPGDVAFVGAQGLLRQKTFRYEVKHFMLPPAEGSANVDKVVQRMRNELAKQTMQPDARQRSLGDREFGTFLWSIRQAVASGKAVQNFSYNNKDYQLKSDRKADKAVGGELVRAGLATDAADIMVVNCAIIGERGSQTSAFRIWYSQRASNWLPLRFEFKPKSYLRLVYQAQTETVKVAKTAAAGVSE